MTYNIYEFDGKKEEIIAKHTIKGVSSFKSAEKAAAFMAGRELGWCIVVEEQ